MARPVSELIGIIQQGGSLDISAKTRIFSELTALAAEAALVDKAQPKSKAVTVRIRDTNDLSYDALASIANVGKGTVTFVIDEE
ncbi:hypothetical protein EON80_24815 [bacterium]|nr:MAG: hypothetical protein EON80_24815 [bacterium]